MKRLYIASLLSLIALAPCQTRARSLSADEALSLAKSQMLQSSPMLKPASQQNLQLAYTQKSRATDANMAYVFADTTKGGFLIAAADDDAPRLVLGYSESSFFDADNIPPAMSWWLEMCAVAVQQAIDGLDNPLKATTADHAVFAAAPKKPQLQAQAAARAEIAPLVSTKWGQDAPYNNMCPMVMGQRSVTGCVATAAAQVMKAHEWPVSGQGSNSYQWIVNGTTYSTSLDFSSITFDWANMTNTYKTSSTKAQKTAVAQLMYACGVACNMNYTPVESGAVTFNMARGLLNYFGYDEGMAYVERAWYTDEEWDNLLYDQLSKNLPVLFSGRDSSNAGHAFVIDGYSSDDYYHVNWGWDGYSDGYFPITDLNPDIQGTGGGSGDSGFNYLQAMTINIMRPQEGSTLNKIMVLADEPLATDMPQYTRNSSTNVYVTGAFYSYALRECEYTLGLHVRGKNIDKFIPWSSDVESLSPMSGFIYFPIRASSFPVGEYEVAPAYKTPDSEWRDMYVDNNVPVKRLYLKVTSSTITVSSPSEVTGEVSAELVSYSPADPNDGNEFYTGHSYDFQFQIASTGPWNGKLQTLLIKDGYYYCKSDDQEFNFAYADNVTSNFTVAFPQNLEPGEYAIVLTYEQSGGYMPISPSYALTVSQEQEAGAGTVSSVEFVGSQTNGASSSAPAVLYTDDLAIKVTLACTEAPWAEDITLCFADPNSYLIFSETAPLSVGMDQAGQTQTLTFNGPWNGVELNETYLMAVFGSKSNQMSNIYYFRVEQRPIEVNSISLTATEANLKVGEAMQLEATVIPNDAADQSLTWKSSNENVAKIEVGENNKINVLAVGEGNAVVTATAANGVHAECAITVTKREQEITWATEAQEMLVGDDLTLSAVASSGLEVAYEITEGADIATLDGNVLHAMSEGEIVVTATQPGNEEFAAAEPVSITITSVKPEILPTAITLSVSEATLTIGEKITITAAVDPQDATDKTVKWDFDDLNAAWIESFDIDHVTLEAQSAGTLTVTATTCNGLSASCVITVVKKQQTITWETLPQEVAEGEDIELNAVASSGLEVGYEITEGADIATLDGNVLHAVGEGEIVVTATQPGNEEFAAAEPVSITITSVKPEILPTAITLSASEATLTIGEKITITATVDPQDATDKTVKWDFDDLNAAWIESFDIDHVTLEAQSAGTLTVTATTCNGLSASCVITVVKKQQTITWETLPQEVAEGEDIELNAVASSGLEVAYEITEGADIATLDGNVLHINMPGKVTVTASQAGDDEYDAADPVSITLYGISGIDDIGQDQNVKVSGNTVTVTGLKDGQNVAIYTFDGKCIYFGADTQISLEKDHAYILCTPRSTYKICIK